MFTGLIEFLQQRQPPLLAADSFCLLGGSLDLVSLLSNLGYTAYDRGLLGIVGRLTKLNDHPSAGFKQPRAQSCRRRSGHWDGLFHLKGLINT